MTVVDQARADIGALIYRHTPRGQLPSSVELRDLLDALVIAARVEGALQPGEAVPVVDGRSVAQLRADLRGASENLERAARAVQALGAGNVDATALAHALFEEAACIRKVAA